MVNNKYKYFVIRTLVLPGLFIAIVVSLFITIPTYYLMELVEDQERVVSRLERQYRSLTSEIRFLLDQYRIFKQYGDQFYDLEARGLVSAVDRPEWIDRILLFGYAYRFDNLNASLLPYSSIKKARLGDKAVPGKLFYLNPVRFSANFPSDIDFLRLNDFIEDKISSFYLFDKCTFADTRISDLYSVERKNLSILGFKGGKGSEVSPIAVSCVFNIITSEPRKRKSK